LRRSHGDDDPFDGEGGTLAHAFFLVYVGDVHFDDEEDWTVNTFRGTSLLMSTSHELGHSLGLSHSDVKSSLMAPFYRG
jgi:matrix metalloproteinase-14 (membrane-inserted)